MQKYSRYAVYYAPEPGTPLADFGARWLGWDPAAGAEVAHPHVSDLDVAALTATPRKYGFHGTLKPPFRPTTDAGALIDAVEALAASLTAFAIPGLQLSRLGAFLALTPAAPCAPLQALAAACVRELDMFRAPASAAELTRRRAAGLTERQEALLTRWGYPYVMEAFRFHLTLTGRLAPEAAARAEAALAPLVAPFCEQPIPVDALTLFGEAEDGRFHVVTRCPLAR